MTTWAKDEQTLQKGGQVFGIINYQGNTNSSLDTTTQPSEGLKEKADLTGVENMEQLKLICWKE